MTVTPDSAEPSADPAAAARAARRAPLLTIRSHEAALEGLRQALDEQARVLVLIGEARAGKTTVMNRLASELADAFTPIYCPAAGLDFQQILDFVLADPRLATSDARQSRDVAALVERVGNATTRPVALLVDDADRAHGSALDQLLRLASGVDRTRERLRVVLSGRPALQDRLGRARDAHPSVSRAIFARLTRLQRPEAESLVERLGATGTRTSVRIEHEAIDLLIETAQGIPGAIVKLHAAAAAAARRRGGQVISLDDVAQAADAPRADLRPSGATQVRGAGHDAPGAAPAPHRPGRRGGSRATLIPAGVAAVTFAIGAGAVALLVIWAHDVTRRALAPSAVATAPAAARPQVATAPPASAAPAQPARLASTALPALPAAGGASDPGASAGAPTAPAAPGPLAAAAPTPGPTASSALDPPREPVERAWNAFHRNALTTPAGDNAIMWAQTALADDPGNARAVEVLHAVIDRYLRWSSSSLERNRLNAARRYLARAQRIEAHATPAQSAAMKVLDDELSRRASRSVGGYHIDAPKWLDDLDAWLRGLPLPRD